MNPLPIVGAFLRRDGWSAIAFVALVAVATALGVAVTVLERAIKSGSARAVDAFDLVVTAPGSRTDALLASVFLQPTGLELLSPEVTANALAEPRIEFAAPLGFGDNVDGDPLVGTTTDLVLSLSDGKLAEGRLFAEHQEAVVGASSPLQVGASFKSSHGLHGDHPLLENNDHDEHDEPMTVVGRMATTGSPWDRAVIVPIEQIWEVHGLANGHPPENAEQIGPPYQKSYLPGVPAVVLKPASVADAYGLRNKYRGERSTAFFPAEVLVELYGLLGDTRRLLATMTLMTQALVIAAILVAVAALLRLKRGDLAMLRAIGAPRRFLMATVWSYTLAIVVAGTLAGLGLGWVLALALARTLTVETGVTISPSLGAAEFILVAILIVTGAILALLPAMSAYRTPVINGLR